MTSNDGGSTDRRRFLKTAGAGAALVTTGLAGCTGGGDGDGGTTGGDGGTTQSGNGGAQTGGTGKPTLDVWLSYYTEGKTKRQYTDQLVKKYQEETGVTINIKGVPYTDIVKKLRAARASGEVPHMVEVMTRPGVLAGGAGLVVNDLWESSTLSDKTADTIMNGHKVWGAQSTGKQGNLVTMPLGFRPYFTAWRTDWLESAGIAPEEVNYKAGSLSWYDDMPGIFDKLKNSEMGKKKGNFPGTTGMKSSDEEYLSLYIPQHGGSLSGVVNLEGTKATIDTPEARKAIKMQFDYIDKGYFHPNSINHGDEESTTMHWSGQIAINHMQDSTDLWGDYLEEQGKAMKNGGYTWGLPRNGGTKASLAWLPSLGFMKEGFQNQKEKDAAVKFLEWWVGDSQRAVKNAEKLGFVPVTPNAIQKEEFFGKTEMHKEFWRGACMKTLKEIKPAVIPAVKGANAITYDIPRSMHQRIHAGTSVEKATAQAAKEINDLLKQNQSA